FGGHDLAPATLVKKAEALAAAGVVPGRLVAAVAAELASVEADLRPAPRGATQVEEAARAVADLEGFAARHRLDRVVVVNLASTEPAAVPDPAHADLDQLRRAMARRRVLP